jgi:hypothetical protein
MMNWEGCRRKQSSVLRYRLRSCLEGNHQKPQVRWASGRDLKTGPSEYEALANHSTAIFGTVARCLILVLMLTFLLVIGLTSVKRFSTN